MVSQSLISAQYVMNSRTGEIGLVNGVGPSPYTFEAMDGVQRVHVTRFIPSASGTMFEASDYWLTGDCLPMANNSRIHVGASATLVSKQGAARTGIVIGVRDTEICVMLSDGLTGWCYFARVAAVVSPLPLTISALAIA